MKAILRIGPHLILPLIASALGAQLGGIVTTEDGRPIEGAWVTLLATSETRTTDGRGRFHFPAAVPPQVVRIELPRFISVEVEVQAPADGSPPHFVLQPKSDVYAEIVVSATRESGDFEPVSVAAVSISPSDRPAPEDRQRPGRRYARPGGIVDPPRRNWRSIPCASTSCSPSRLSPAWPRPAAERPS